MGFLDSVGNFLLGSDNDTKTTTKTLTPLDPDSQKIWDDFMSSYGSLKDNLSGQQGYLTDAFGKYSSVLKSSGDTYQGVLKGLIDSISSGKNDLSFSLGGGNSASFTPRSVRENASTISDLAKSSYDTSLVQPKAQFGFDSTVNDYATSLSLFDILASLTKDIKDRQAQLATTTTKESGGSTGLNEVLGGLTETGGGIAQLAAMFI